MEWIGPIWQALTGQLAWWHLLVIAAVAVVGVFKGGAYLKWWLVIRATAADAYENVEEQFGPEYAEGLKKRVTGFAKLGPYMEYIIGALDDTTAEKFKRSPTAQGLAAKAASKLAKSGKL